MLNIHKNENEKNYLLGFKKSLKLKSKGVELYDAIVKNENLNKVKLFPSDVNNKNKHKV